MGSLGQYAAAAQASMKAQQKEQAGDMYQKAAKEERDPVRAAAYLQQAASALLESRSFTKCFEMALKHSSNKSLFPTKVSPQASSPLLSWLQHFEAGLCRKCM